MRIWKNVASPGDRERRVDLFVGEPNANGEPDISKVRIAIENKSVITAHRNRTNRFDDLKKVLAAVQGERPEALLIATVLIGRPLPPVAAPGRLDRFALPEPGPNPSLRDGASTPALGPRLQRLAPP